MSVWSSISEVRKRSPLVHCYTNAVASNYAANALIATGSSPMMAAEPLEAKEVTSLADALSVNIGTLTPITADAMLKSAQVAVERGIPWVFDPVGIGASELRKDTSKKITALGPHIIRGNGSEIATLSRIYAPESQTQVHSDARGIDSAVGTDDVVDAAKALAVAANTVVVISGKVDWIVDKHRVTRVVNGHPKMAEVTATGCACTAILGAFLAVSPNDPFWAAAHGMSYYAVAGELAAAEAKGTGSMAMLLLDKLGAMTELEYTSLARPLIDLSLYLVTDPVLLAGRPLEEVVEDALSSRAVTIVQLREKDCESGEFYAKALKIKQICDKYHVPLLIDDRVDIALAIDCAGVHIGQTDIPPTVARKLLGKNKIIGLSAHTTQQIQTAHDSLWDIDYFGVGPVYATQTKNVKRPQLTPEGFGEIAKTSRLPVVAIGGLKPDNVATLPQVADGAAVVTGITTAKSPKDASTLLLQNFRSRK